MEIVKKIRENRKNIGVFAVTFVVVSASGVGLGIGLLGKDQPESLDGNSQPKASSKQVEESLANYFTKETEESSSDQDSQFFSESYSNIEGESSYSTGALIVDEDYYSEEMTEEGIVADDYFEGADELAEDIYNDESEDRDEDEDENEEYEDPGDESPRYKLVIDDNFYVIADDNTGYVDSLVAKQGIKLYAKAKLYDMEGEEVKEYVDMTARVLAYYPETGEEKELSYTSLESGMFMLSITHDFPSPKYSSVVIKFVPTEYSPIDWAGTDPSAEKEYTIIDKSSKKSDPGMGTVQVVLGADVGNAPPYPDYCSPEYFVYGSTISLKDKNTGEIVKKQNYTERPVLTFINVEPGDYVLNAEYYEMASDDYEISVSADEAVYQRMVLNNVPSKSWIVINNRKYVDLEIEGQVIDGYLRGIGNTGVKLYRRTESGSLSLYRTTKTNEYGYYTFENLQPFYYYKVVYAEKAGYDWENARYFWGNFLVEDGSTPLAYDLSDVWHEVLVDELVEVN